MGPPGPQERVLRPTVPLVANLDGPRSQAAPHWARPTPTARPLLTPLPPLSRSLGKTYHVLGKYNEAITHHERAVGISVAIGDRKGEAADLGHLGAAYNRIGQST